MTKDFERQVQIALAVHYEIDQGMKRQEIARKLGVSPSKVTQMLEREAIWWGWLERRFVRSKIPELVQAAIAKRLKSEETSTAISELLAENNFPRLKSCIVHDSQTGISGASDWPRRLELFSRNIAYDLGRILAPGKLVGVAWGGTLESALIAMEKALDRAGSRLHGGKAVPVAGDPIGASQRTSSSVLAGRLHRIFNGPEAETLSLSGLPAIFPMSLPDDAVATLTAFYRRTPGYGSLMGQKDRTGLKDELDTLLTSVGTPRMRAEVYGQDEFPAVYSQIGRLRPHTSGDVGGILLPKNRVPKEIAGDIAKYERCWTGLKLGDLERISNRSRRGPAPGVVIVSLGAEKAEPILSLLRRGLVNHLVIDQELHAALEARLKALPSRPGGKAGRTFAPNAGGRPRFPATSAPA